MTAFFDLSSYLLAVAFSKPEQFCFLTLISAMMVCSAGIIFTVSNSPPLCGNPETDDDTSDLLHNFSFSSSKSHRNYGSVVDDEQF